LREAQFQRLQEGGLSAVVFTNQNRRIVEFDRDVRKRAKILDGDTKKSHQQTSRKRCSKRNSNSAHVFEHVADWSGSCAEPASHFLTCVLAAAWSAADENLQRGCRSGA
jgi:hypothetical protein